LNLLSSAHRSIFLTHNLNAHKKSKSSTDEPNAPGKPDIIDYDNQSVTLKWEPPKSDGGRPVTHYIIEMLNKYQPDWAELMPTDTNACEFKVPGLKERMAYQFRVRAVNKAGKSAPSPPTENHIVRHRNRKYFQTQILSLTHQRQQNRNKHLTTSSNIFSLIEETCYPFLEVEIISCFILFLLLLFVFRFD
jgi:hypothetical protein